MSQGNPSTCLPIPNCPQEHILRGFVKSASTFLKQQGVLPRSWKGFSTIWSRLLFKSTTEHPLPVSAGAGEESNFPFCGKSHAFKCLSSLDARESKIFSRFPAKQGKRTLAVDINVNKDKIWDWVEGYCFYINNVLQHLKKHRNKNTSWNGKPRLFFLEKACQNCCLQTISVLSNGLFPMGKHSCRKFPTGSQAGLCNIKVTRSGFCFCSPRISTAQLLLSQKMHFTENCYIGIELNRRNLNILISAFRSSAGPMTKFKQCLRWANSLFFQNLNFYTLGFQNILIQLRT